MLLLLLDRDLFPVSDVTVFSAPQSGVSPSHFSGPAAERSLALSVGQPAEGSDPGGSGFERESVARGSGWLPTVLPLEGRVLI